MMNLLISLFGIVSLAYDIGCIYPDKLDPDPFVVRYKVSRMLNYEVLVNLKYETPLVVRTGHMMAACQAKCLSILYDNVNDPMHPTEPEPLGVGFPDFVKNAHSHVMCHIQCLSSIHEGLGSVSRMYRDLLIENYDIDLEDTSDDVIAAVDSYLAGSDPKVFNSVIVNNNYHPYTTGMVAGEVLRRHFLNDGWNQDGMKQWDAINKMEAECTGSCRMFQDYTGYTPVADPRTSDSDDDWTVASKYDCEGSCRRWQPLEEADEYGNFVQQKFVVPHIGKALTHMREPTLTLATPVYNYREESLQVIEELRITASDPVRKEEIRLFDDKVKVRAMHQNTVKRGLRDVHSYQDHMLYIWGLSLAEYDAVIQGWHEKKAHDLVRPTTVIKSWGDDILHTYGGDMSVDGPVDIAARDFEASIRVMPHPEHPSGSSCLCRAYTEFTDTYTIGKYGKKMKNPQWGGGSIMLKWDDMEQVTEHCGLSRLWGGLHYPQAIPDGEKICEGLGTLAYDWVTNMKTPEEDWNGAPYYQGDGLPECSET